MWLHLDCHITLRVHKLLYHTKPSSEANKKSCPPGWCILPEQIRKIDWKEVEAPLSREEIEKSLRQVKDWQLSDNAIEKSFKFESFQQAIDFINDIAKEAIAQNHHPAIQLWNITCVKVTIKTLCIDGLSNLDFMLAAAIDRLPASMQARH